MIDFRPLGVGEMLDRAVTLAVKNFVLFALILVAYRLVVYGISLLYAHEAPALLHAVSLDTFIFLRLGPASVFLYSLITGLLEIVLSGALIAAANAAYRSQRIAFVEVYRTAFRRWPSLFGYNVVWIVGFLIVFIPIGIALVQSTGAPRSAEFVFVTAGILWLVIGFVRTPYVCGSFRCVVEERSSFEAFTASMKNEFSRALWGRSFVIGFVFQAFGLLSFVPLVTRFWSVGSHIHLWTGFVPVFFQIAEGVVAIYLSALGAVVYYDMRVRGEGLDLQLSAAQAAGTA